MKKLLDKPGRGYIFTPFVLELLVILFLVEFVKGALLVSILPIYMGTVLGLTTFAIGWAFSLQYIGDNIFRSPVGWIVERIGYRTSMVIGLLITFVAVGLIAYATNVFWIVTACALLGAGTSPLWPCVVTGATQVAGKEAQGTVLSIVYVAWLSGTGIGPVVINFFIAQSYVPAFRLLLICMGIVTFVALWLPDRKQTEEIHKRKSVKAAISGKLTISNLWAKVVETIREIKRTLHVSKLFYPAMFLQTFSIGVLVPVITLYARTVLGLSASQYSMLLIVGGGITVVCLIPMGKWVDKMGTKWFLHIGFGLTAAGLAVFTMTRSLVFIYFLVSLIGLGYALIIPAWNAFIASVIPKSERGAVWGFFLTIEGSGMVIGPILSGKIWDTFGSHAPFWVSAAVLALLFVLHIFISARPKIMVR